MTGFRYTPRTVGIIKQHARTLTPATIAILMRCPVSTIELICKKHDIEVRESDKVEPAPRAADTRTFPKKIDIDIDAASFIVVTNEARRRGTRPKDLIADLIEAIADDCMFSAVLDK